MIIRNVLYADEGKVLTNGEVYGKTIFLEVGAKADDYREIPEEEYNRIMAEEAGDDLETLR